MMSSRVQRTMVASWDRPCLRIGAALLAASLGMFAGLAAQSAWAADTERELKEKESSPGVLATVNRLRQEKIQKNWHFTPVPTSATVRSLSVLAGARVPANFKQHVVAQNAEARLLLARLREPPRATSTCNASVAVFDWRKANGSTPVKDQEQCGSCWDFAAHGAFEGNWRLTNLAVIDSSEQNTLDCNGSGSCGGGWPSDALSYLTRSGSASNQSYPYQAADKSCRVPTVAQPYKAYAWGYVSDSDSIASVDQLKQAMCYHGPLAVGIDATEALQSYGTEEVFDEHADGSVNHVVTMIGWDDTRHAWLIKNSWGTGWGSTAGFGSERGYAWIDYTSNKIGYGAAWVQVQQATPVQQGKNHGVENS